MPESRENPSAFDTGAMVTSGSVSLRTLNFDLDEALRAARQAEPVISIAGLSHSFGRTRVLEGIDLQVSPGEIVLMTGPSGSGKTTLLTLVGGLRAVQEGSLRVLGRELRGLDDEQLVALRRDLGFIFQGHNLFEALTALQNVRMGLELHGGSRHENDRKARRALEQVGLAKHLHKKPDALSGGQRQRVAVARALAPRPKLVLADEPTAALDAGTGLEVVQQLQQLCEEEGAATILVTHDNRILEVADRIVNMVDGRLASDVAVRESLEVCEFLSKVPVFRGYTPGALAEIAEEMTTRTVPAEEVIFRQGDPGEEFYVIWKGRVMIFDEKDSATVAVLEPGQFFGEMALVSGNPRNATAQVESDAVLLCLSKEDFQNAMQREKNFQMQLRETLSLRR